MCSMMFFPWRPCLQAAQNEQKATFRGFNCSTTTSSLQCDDMKLWFVFLHNQNKCIKTDPPYCYCSTEQDLRNDASPSLPGMSAVCSSLLCITVGPQAAIVPPLPAVGPPRWATAPAVEVTIRWGLKHLIAGFVFDKLCVRREHGPKTAVSNRLIKTKL